MEEQSGIVIWLDATSTGFEFDKAKEDIPSLADASSISILASPACSYEPLPTGQTCRGYGESLLNYFSTEYPHMVRNGFEGESGITFKIVTSTAVAMSRMTLANLLLCLPRSPSCLLPAFVRSFNGKQTIVWDDSASMKAVQFLTEVGNLDASMVKVIDEGKILLADHEQSVELLDSEGYPSTTKKARIPTDEEIKAMGVHEVLNFNKAAAADLRGLRFDLFDSWRNEAEWIEHKQHFTTNVTRYLSDPVKCSDDSKLHLRSFTQAEKELWKDYSIQVNLRGMLHNTEDPGVATLKADEHAYLVFYQAGTHPNISIWNDKESLDFDWPFVVPDPGAIFDSYAIVDLPDGDYVTHTHHFPGNYGHFLHDHLPPIAYARHVMPDNVKFILIKNENDRRTLRFIDPDFEANRVIWAEEQTIYRVSKGSMSGLPPPITRFIINRFNLLREWVLKKPSFVTDQKTIVYYRRGGSDLFHGRTMDPSHERYLIQIIREKMAAHGRTEHLVIFDGQEYGSTMSLQHQFDLFRTTSIAIGPHGSGLANILWLPGVESCEDRSKLLEFLVQPKQEDIQAGGSYKTYMYLYGFPQWVNYHHLFYTDDSTSDKMKVDLVLFTEALDELFGDGNVNKGSTRQLVLPSVAKVDTSIPEVVVESTS